MEVRRTTRFLQFDVVSFYPSITKEILGKALEWAKQYSYLADKSIEIIMHSRKSVLWYDNEIWVKKKDPEFDVTMGSYDGGEVCEVCSLDILSLLKERGIFKEGWCAMFKDDG